MVANTTYQFNQILQNSFLYITFDGKYLENRGVQARWSIFIVIAHCFFVELAESCDLNGSKRYNEGRSVTLQCEIVCWFASASTRTTSHSSLSCVLSLE